jgi:hypothetical protein
MIICPWCGTNYLAFQTNCTNCGGPLQAAAQENRSSAPGEDVVTPPLAPRPISPRYVWRLLSSDGWAIASGVFVLLGIIFGLVGAALTVAIVTAIVGIPFLLLGILFLGAGVSLLIWRYQTAQKIVGVLRDGAVARGQIVDVQQNYSVRINGRNPWVIRYQFQADGAAQEGKVTTLNSPGQQFQSGKPVSILYLPGAPKWNSIYPHP